MSDPRILLQPGPDGRLLWALDLPADIADEAAAALTERASALRDYVAKVSDNSPATDKQIWLLGKLAGDQGLDLATETARRYNCVPADLRKRQASDLIGEWKGDPTPGTPVERPADPPTGPATPRPGTPASEAQIKAIFAVARQANWRSDDVKARVWHHYGVHVDQLTKAEASQFIDYLNGKIDQDALPVAHPGAPPAEQPALPESTADAWEDLGTDATESADVAAARENIRKGLEWLERKGWYAAQQLNWLRKWGPKTETVSAIPVGQLAAAVADLHNECVQAQVKAAQAQGQTNGKAVAGHAAH